MTDHSGNSVSMGPMVRIVRLDERGLRGLTEGERNYALSMVGQCFEVWEIDEYGRPCVMKQFPGETPDSADFHEVALDPDEYELVARA